MAQLMEVIGMRQWRTNLTIGQFIPRLFAVAKDLPENDSKAPDIRLNGKRPVQDAFWGHPANW